MLLRANPLGFFIVIIGLALFLGILLGIAVLVSFLALVLIGMVLPAILFALGLYWIAKGRTRIGLIVVLIAILLFISQAYGWVRF